MEKINNYFVRTTHFYNSLEEICYDILEFICLNVSAVRRFCTLTKEDCVTDIEKEVIKQLRDRNYKYAINKLGLWEGIHKRWNVYVPEKFQSFLGCVLMVLLEDPYYENFICVVSISKGTYFGKVDFINAFLMDFCLLLYISGYSGKTMEECNVMVMEIGKNSDVVSDTAQKMKFSIKDFFSKCEQIRSFLRVRSHLLKKSLMENFIFCAVRQRLFFWL